MVKTIQQYTSKQIIAELKANANPRNLAGMTRFKVGGENTLGINIPVLRKLAKQIGKNHKLAIELWDTRIHEAKILASMIDEFEKVTISQMDRWVSDFDSWDICDQVCGNLFDKTKFAEEKIFKWAKDEREFVRRAAFATIAWLAIHNKNTRNEKFIRFFGIIIRHSTDSRNFVKKAVSWALREIGKRNKFLNKKAIALAKEMKKINSQSSRWIANNVLRELTDKNVQMRLVKKIP